MAATAAVSAGTVVVVRQAIGGGDLVNSLSQSQVRAQYDAAGRPTPAPLTPSSIAPTVQPHSTSAATPPTTHAPAHTHTGGSSSSSSSSSTGHHSSPSTPSSPPPPPATVTRVLTSQAGSVVVRCTSGTVYLVSWSPAQGYQVDDVRRGPDHEAEIDFEGGGHSVSVTYGCSTSGPVQHVSSDDGGGGDDGLGGGGDR